MGTKRVYKKRNGKLCGVCGGLGDYFNVDPVLLRVLWVIFGFTGAGVIAYFVCAAILPYEDQI
jgi:phage shock protein C